MIIVPYFYLIIIAVFLICIKIFNYNKDEKIFVLIIATIISALVVFLATIMYDTHLQTKKRNLYNETYDTICTITSRGVIMKGINNNGISYGNRKATINFTYDNKRITTNEYLSECITIRKRKQTE